MKIFSKQHAGEAVSLRPTTTSEKPAVARRVRARGASDPLPVSMDEARRQVGASAKEARAEIESLVIAERAQLETMMEEAVQAVEARLRGATEQRIDLEMKRVEDAGNKLRRDLKRTIRAEVSRIAKSSMAADVSEGGRNRSVPIRARA